jgi:hypothetical protein
MAQQAAAINKSLSALGDVVSALTEGAAFVPYRNHKLTQLMADSLGGNAKCCMIVNVRTPTPPLCYQFYLGCRCCYALLMIQHTGGWLGSS